MADSEPLPHEANLDFIEELYAAYLRDPAAVAADWRAYFERWRGANPLARSPRRGPSFRPASIFDPGGNGHHPSSAMAETTAEMAAQPDLAGAVLQEKVDQLIRNYRARGHMIAAIDPLGQERPMQPELEPSFHGISPADLDRPVSATMLFGAPPVATVRQIWERLRNTYCRSIGVQFMHIDDIAVRRWLEERMESSENRLELAREQQIRIFTRLTDAVIFEEFLQRKFVGAKSFSLEGAESLIPLLELAIEKAGSQEIDEIVLAMAHRGRLNVLANIMGKEPRRIFREFDDKHPELHLGSGDVKYHLGYGRDWRTASGHSVHLSLCFNPSHLEFIDPVALGRIRAKQDCVGDHDRSRGFALLIHGDAAFAGQGVIQEVLNLSRLPGYATGGTLHVVVNNQIGFTTSPAEGRTGSYATGIGRTIQAPIFHVNGEDPEAVAQVVSLALDFRREFRRDVIADMYCYRRRGHNEGDEPSFTQPIMYRLIEKMPGVREAYLQHLLRLGGLTQEQADAIAQERRAYLEAELQAARSGIELEALHRRSAPSGLWAGYLGGPEERVPEVPTGAPRERLAALLEIQTRLPEGFHPHPKIVRGLEHRREMARGERPLDWSAAESLAFATVAGDGVRVRLSGQDSARGTFSQRHAVLHDYQDGHTYVPLQHLDPAQAPVEMINSPLSELGVLGFEYGYTLDTPNALVLWEAQFGDFINAAQVIVDQFLASAEDKWGRLSGLVLLLPHGFEGMGPEHSSARLERFLALAAEDNLQVANPTTPAQYFHLLRRQALRPWRKPLVVMTPKSLLRHPAVSSSLEELATGSFQRLLPDALEREASAVRRVLWCSGKLYYELAGERERLGREDVAILRLEQLCPLPDELLRAAFASYADGTPVFWAQEEPENMGAWRWLRARFGARLLERLPFAGIYRRTSASPATGSAASHKLEQRRLIDLAFGDSGGEV